MGDSRLHAWNASRSLARRIASRNENIPVVSQGRGSGGGEERLHFSLTTSRTEVVPLIVCILANIRSKEYVYFTNKAELHERETEGKVA